MATKQEFFPTIGNVVEKTASVPDATAPANADATDADEVLVQEIESLCMNCRQNGTTRLLLTSIPYFREVIVMSFRCEHCGWQNNEVQSAGIIKEHGTAYTVRILDRKDLDRQLVKSPTCTVIIPEYELTIPPGKGQLTTVEGILRDTVTGLSVDQPLRRIQAEEAYNKIEGILNAFRAILGDEEDDEVESKDETKDAVKVSKKLPMEPFTLKLDDPAGNSFIEFVGSMADPKWNLRTYSRTRQQNIDLGLIASDEPTNAAVSGDGAPQAMKVANKEQAEEALGGGLEGQNEEIFTFPGTCSSCGAKLDTLMKKVNIPYFKDILIMSTNCDHCGYRDNEVKSGSAISDKGKRITLKVEDQEDLSRDILKSESCGLKIPEIDLVLQAGTLGGRFTTLEGLLDQVYEELSEKVFASGDSVVTDDRKTFEKFLADLKSIKAAERPFTVILEDPLANSYVQNLYAPDPDPNMTIEMFDRTWEQNEDLGLNDMKVEGYEADAKVDGEKVKKG
ncbi:zf-ZPR1-domain-containing protein [Fomitiporia mediterranea MF3/22]|uniref:zf-ZPR1-domain-containing protein n=1 Tax=Fomitiporia mediterranea (strain MF3/22) TaxID=694068 RepID=UPI00044080FC|nr:zf-ZPR1-domain-containing protein [Fomitiporia mediterranea MF3/22]EJD08535.1 zf-ZPR1-domain-containing protein [Fomitiporia mediterranea MF3/22]